MSEIRVAFLTFGCRANQYETAVMEGLLGAQRIVPIEDADVVVINACTVTALAERKARQAARRLHRARPDRPVVVIGCLADAVEQATTRFEDGDLLAGNAWKPRIVEAVDRATAGERGLLPPAPPLPLAEERSRGQRGRIRAFLRVQDGCSRACTYCRTTQVRGTPRSKPLTDVVEEAAELTRLGFPELVLTGIDLAQYAPPDGTLTCLVRQLLEIDAIRRLRIASINPSGVVAPLIDAIASDSRASRHIHIPLQSGDNRVLDAMARGYTTAEYLDCIRAVRERIPEATFGTDIIVGFPGEDGDAFDNTMQIVQQVGFTNLHAFRYSPRAGTPAANFPDPVSPAVQRERADLLDRVWRDGLRNTLDKRIGSIHHVLVEARHADTWRGYTSDYLYVHFTSDEELPVGSIRPVRITAVVEDHLEGTIDA